MTVSDDGESDTSENLTTVVPQPAKLIISLDVVDEEEQEAAEEKAGKERGEESLDDSDQDMIIRPGARRQGHRLSTPALCRSPHRYHTRTDDEEDLREEARELTSSVRKGNITDRRTRDAGSRNKRKSQFRKHLDSLKKRKRRLDTELSFDDEEEEEEEEEEMGKKVALYDSDSDAVSVASKDFVVEDDRTRRLEELLEIPPEFTALSYQGLQLKFKVVVQAEVYALLHPFYQNMDYSGFVPSW